MDIAKRTDAESEMAFRHNESISTDVDSRKQLSSSNRALSYARIVALYVLHIDSLGMLFLP